MSYIRFRPLLAEALDPRLYTVEFLDWLWMASQHDERVRFWFSDNAAIVVEVRAYPTGAKVIHGLAAAGELGEIVELLIPRAEAWGSAIGCVLAIIESRPGWARTLKQHGYEPHQQALRKEIA